MPEPSSGSIRGQPEPPLRELLRVLGPWLALREPWLGAVTALDVMRAGAGAAGPGHGTDAVVAGVALVPDPATAAAPPPPVAIDLAALKPDASTAPVVAQVRRAAAGLHWRQNPGYRDPGFLRRYAYCELLGPAGHVLFGDVAIGLLYLAPRTFYPPHAHPAEEAYHVLAGASDWQQGRQAPRRCLPGDRIEHPGGIAHSMHSGASPLLALYVWRGALAEPARLV